VRALFLCVLAFGACAPDSALPDDDGANSEALSIFTLADGERPEIGRLGLPQGWCTATLIGSRTVLSAAHCFDATSSNIDLAEVPLAFFEIHPIDGSALVRYPTHRVRADQAALNLRFDLAIVQLDEPVPATVATPLPLAGRWPARNNMMTVFGYGRFGAACDSPSDGHKRKWRRPTEGLLRTNTCIGDSGAPFIDDASGTLLAVVTGDILGFEWFADAVGYNEWLTRFLAESEAGSLSI